MHSGAGYGIASAIVPVVQRRKVWFVETLDDSQHGSIDGADVRVIVAVAEYADPPVVVRMQFFDPVGAGFDVIEQGGQHAGMQPGVDPVIDLHKHGRGNDQGSSAVSMSARQAA